MVVFEAIGAGIRRFGVSIFYLIVGLSDNVMMVEVAGRGNSGDQRPGEAAIEIGGWGKAILDGRGDIWYNIYSYDHDRLQMEPYSFLAYRLELATLVEEQLQNILP
ncbi:hypothetical protein LWI29_024200 [Acer saccharum]|uniref:Uncharacterized protein n=1 Tax=Acer saccharum TaxID=4024 RepID=A0AA39TDV1_ACESA|nr:hypothetical protein LWI29_024200 [Acer saccharum]